LKETSKPYWQWKKQAGAELRQAQFKLGLAQTAFPDVDIVFVFVFSVLKS
jgi:hypothetical protein